MRLLLCLFLVGCTVPKPGANISPITKNDEDFVSYILQVAEHNVPLASIVYAKDYDFITSCASFCDIDTLDVEGNWSLGQTNFTTLEGHRCAQRISACYSHTARVIIIWSGYSPSDKGLYFIIFPDRDEGHWEEVRRLIFCHEVMHHVVSPFADHNGIWREKYDEVCLDKLKL